MTLVTIYQANNPETLPVNLATPEIVLESELPDRLQHTTGITYEDDDRDGHYKRINQPLSVNGHISSTNLTTMNTNLQTITMKVIMISYMPAFQTTMIGGDLTVDTLNGVKIGASDEGFGYSTDAPYIPICKANGITEVGRRIEFHLNDATFRDYSVSLDNTAINRLSIISMTADTYGNLELGGLLVRKDGANCRLTTNGQV